MCKKEQITPNPNGAGMQEMYTELEMTDFAAYILSKQRQNRIMNNYSERDPVTLDGRLREVYHADIENWKEAQRRRDIEAAALYNDLAIQGMFKKSLIHKQVFCDTSRVEGGEIFEEVDGRHELYALMHSGAKIRVGLFENAEDANEALITLYNRVDEILKQKREEAQTAIAVFSDIVETM